MPLTLEEDRAQAERSYVDPDTYWGEADTTITVGDFVRSYDFDSRNDCYVEGVVMGVVKLGSKATFTGYEARDCDHYEIRVTRFVRAGQEAKNANCRPGFSYPAFVYPPVNGTPTWTDDVTKLVKKTHHA